MKKARKLWVAAVALITAVVMIGCNGLTGVTVDTNDVARDASLITLNAKIANFSDFDTVTERSAGRTILPDALTDVSNTKYNYYLVGTTITGVALTDPASASTTAIDITSLVDNGEFKYSVASAAWEFRLYAVQKDNPDITYTDLKTEDKVAAVAQLAGFVYADLTNSNGTVYFVLSPDGLTGKGNLTLTLVLSDDGGKTTWNLTDATAKIELQNYTTGAIPEYKPGNNTAKAFKIETPDSAFAIPSGETLNKNTKISNFNVDAGIYNLVVTFTPTDTTKPSSVWSDVLVVVANRKITQTVYIPNIIGKKPEKVTSLKAFYIEDSESERGSDFYKVGFVWDAKNVNNERYFELEIGDMSTVNMGEMASEEFVDPTSGAWSLPSGATVKYVRYAPQGGMTVVATDGPATTTTSYNSADENVLGSLVANNDAVIMWMKLGTPYQARIRAVNNVGSSDWTALTIPASGINLTTEVPNNSSISALNGKVAYFANGDTPTSTVNRGYIKYMLNGGKYGSETRDKVEYFMRDKLTTTDTTTPANNASPTALWAANGDSLMKGGASFTYWSTVVPNKIVDENLKASDYRVYRAVTPGANAAGYACILPTNGGATATAGEEGYKYIVTTDGLGTKGVAKMAANYGADGKLVTGKTSANFMELDDGGYNGFKNLILYADYSGDLNGNITVRDQATDYNFYADWITYKSSNATAATLMAADTTVSSSTFALSKAANTKDSKCEVEFSVSVPSVKYNSSENTDKKAVAADGDAKKLAKGVIVTDVSVLYKEDSAINAVTAPTSAADNDELHYIADGVYSVIGNVYRKDNYHFVQDVNNTFYIKSADDAAKKTIYVSTQAADNYAAATGASAMIKKADYILNKSAADTAGFKVANIYNTAYELYDSITVTITDPNGAIKASETVEPTAFDTAVAFPKVNMLYWENAAYQIKFTATKTTSGKTIVRTAILTMNLQD